MSCHYVGTELERFAAAANWKSYFGALLRPFCGHRVLEIGAGIGSNVPYLWSDRVCEWTCLEPDPVLAGRIKERVAGGALPASCRVEIGTIARIEPAACFDSILYLDVIEHIVEDRAELALARRHLAPCGNLVVLAPAHQFLFSAFDAAIGHHRRYSRASLIALAPPDAELVACRMLDCVGLFASFGNKAVLSSASPTKRQIAIWDRLMVPVSRALDRPLGYRFGKTILAVWQALA
jgi:SAM-dependent methyltransferase